MIIHEHATCDHLIPTSFLKRPKSARLDVWRLPGLRPRANVVRGVHRGAFREQKLRSRDVAGVRRKVQRRVASGAFSPGKPSGRTRAQRPRRRWGTTKVVGMRSSTRSTDKRTMNVLDSTSSKLFKAKKHSQTH